MAEPTHHPKFDVLRATAEDLQSLLMRGQTTSVEIVQTYLAQIARHNYAGLHLRAVISLRPTELLLNHAMGLDDERAKGKSRGPLHGIPVLIKDSIITSADLGMPTTAGAFAFETGMGIKNAPIIDQLIAAGVIPIAKASLTEFCGLRASAMTAGYSAIGGQTQSPYIKGGRRSGDGIAGHTGPGGSSSGSAVGVAAGFAPIAIGTDTVGSIVLPANRAGLYALRMSSSLIDVTGTSQLARGWDTVGPMAKHPGDLVPLVEGLVKPEMKSTVSHQLFEEIGKGWSGFKLGFVDFDQWPPLGQLSASTPEDISEMKRQYRDVMELLRNLGAKVISPIDVPFSQGLKYKGDSVKSITDIQFKDLLEEFSSGLRAPKVKTLKELVEFNDRNKERAIPEPHPDQMELLTALRNTRETADAEEIAANLKEQATKGLLGVFESRDNPVDVIVAPSDSMLVSSIAAAGFTAGVVPFGHLPSCGQPQGITIAAKMGEESKLLRFMKAWEAIVPPREVPPHC